MSSGVRVCSQCVARSQLPPLDYSIMDKKRSFISILLLTFSLGFVSVAKAAMPVPAAPAIAAKGYLLMDFQSGHILASNNIDERLEPASLTKMMTSYVVYAEMKNGSFTEEDEVLISERAWRMKGSRMFIEVGKHVKVGELLKGLVIQSGNDATVALAEMVAGSEDSFAAYMNQYAQKLGMSSTNFVNSTGWPDPNHYTTARDMALLGQALIRDFPEQYKMYAQKEFYFNKIKQLNRNRLLWRDKSVDGIKTGHTEAAGFCLVASAQRDEMRLISVVMGAKSDKQRAAESQKLLNYGFRFYESRKIYTAAEVIEQGRIWMGDQETVPLGVVDDFIVTIPRGQDKELDIAMILDKNITAPIQQGQELGTLKVSLKGEVMSERPLVALTDVAEGGIVTRVWHSILRYFE